MIEGICGRNTVDIVEVNLVATHSGIDLQIAVDDSIQCKKRRSIGDGEVVTGDRLKHSVGIDLRQVKPSRSIAPKSTPPSSV